MTPSQYIKAQGLPSTAYVAKAVNKPVQTIDNWYRDNFAVFEAVVAGVNSFKLFSYECDSCGCEFTIDNHSINHCPYCAADDKHFREKIE